MELMWRPAAIENWTQSQHVHPITMYNLHWLFKQYKSDRMLCLIACFLNECNTLFPIVHGPWVWVNSDLSCPSNPLNRIEAIVFLFWFIQCT
jgi:hypothetical protein